MIVKIWKGVFRHQLNWFSEFLYRDLMHLPRLWLIYNSAYNSFTHNTNVHKVYNISFTTIEAERLSITNPRTPMLIESFNLLVHTNHINDYQRSIINVLHTIQNCNWYKPRIRKQKCPNVWSVTNISTDTNQIKRNRERNQSLNSLGIPRGAQQPRKKEAPIEINPGRVSLNPQTLYFKTTKRSGRWAGGPHLNLLNGSKEQSNLLFQRGDSATKAEVLLLNLVHGSPLLLPPGRVSVARPTLAAGR